MTGLLVSVSLLLMAVCSVYAGYLLGAGAVRYKRTGGAPYRDQKEVLAVRAASLSEILGEVPRSGWKLLALFLVACACTFFVGDGGRTAGSVKGWIMSFSEPSVADAVEEVYTRYRLMNVPTIDEYGNEVEAPLSPSERALTAAQLMEWIDEYGSDAVYEARGEGSSSDERHLFALRVLRERRSFDDSVVLSSNIPRGSGVVFGRDCDNSNMELAFLTVRALRANWPVSEQAFRAVYDAATSLECSDWPGSNTYYEAEYREASMVTLRRWRDEHPEDFSRIMARLHLGHQLER